MTYQMMNMIGKLTCCLTHAVNGVHCVLQQTSKIESELYDSSYEDRLPILADLVLYYCRHATRPALMQLYQAEVRPGFSFLSLSFTLTYTHTLHISYTQPPCYKCVC